MLRLQRLQYDRGSGNQMKLTNGVQIPLSLDFADFSNLVVSFIVFIINRIRLLLYRTMF